MGKIGAIRVAVGWLAISVCVQAQQYVFHAYRQAEGLRNLDVNAMAADRNGFLWVATENGVYRFLGSGFERFGPEQGIAELDVFAVSLDSNGTVWVGTRGNLYRWNGERFIAAGSVPVPVTAWNSMVVEDAHHLLVVNKHRIFRLEHDGRGRMSSYLPVFSDKVVGSMPDLAKVSSVSVVHEPNGETAIWVGGGKRLYSWVDSQAAGTKPQIAIPKLWGMDQGLSEDTWEGVFEDHAGALWAGGRYHVAVLAPGAGPASHFVDRSIPGSTAGNEYSHAPFMEDREGRILAPCEDGIARWDGSRWQVIGRANGLQLTGHVVSMAFDAAGDPWIATRGDGLYNWAGYADWEGWNDVEKLPSAVIWAIAPSSDGRMYIGTDKGPGWIDPHTGSSGRLVTTQRWTFGQLDTLGFNRDSTLWGGTFSAAVLRIAPKTAQAEQTAKLPAFITRSLADSSGRVFFTTDNGIFVRESKDSRAAPQRVVAADRFLTGTTQVNAGCQSPNGTLWFMTTHRLLRLKDGIWNEPPIDGMPKGQGTLLDMSCAADGAIWVTGQQSGTWRLRPGGDRLDAWQLDLPRDVQTLTPVSIVADRRGWVWLATDSGLLVWNGQSWRHLTQESGIVWNDLNQGAMLEAGDGSMWIGTSGGVAHLLHPERVFNAVPLQAVITGIERGSESYSAGQEIKLPWSRLPLRFQVSTPAMRNRSELIFKVRMEGLHSDWIESRDGMAVFSSLPPGDYTFMAMATNPSLSAFSSVVKLRVVILPPWWRNKWFFALYTLLFLLLFWAGDRLRARHLRLRARELAKMVQDRTLELEERTRELEASREQLRIQAAEDGLTGMLNHVAILRALTAEMDRSRRENKTLVVAMADLDHFKRVNDVYGHLAGDEALRTFATAVGAAIRTYDHSGRYGGEEFLLILTEIPREGIEQRLAGLHASISGLEVTAGEYKFRITCSIGATVFDPCGLPKTVETLLAVADRALYAAKSAGRDRVIFRDAESAEDAQQRSPLLLP